MSGATSRELDFSLDHMFFDEAFDGDGLLGAELPDISFGEKTQGHQ